MVRKIRNALIMIIILLLLLLLLNSYKLTYALVSRSNEQTTQIHKLEQEVTRLESNIAYEHNKIQSLSNQHPKVEYITKEVPKQETVRDRIVDPLSPTTTIIGTLATLGTMIKNISIFSLTSR